MIDRFRRLFRPASIAVFGGTWAENVIEQCKAHGYGGDIWPVHPSRDTMAGIPCVKSIDDLPGVPDASFIGVNREATVEIVGQLSKRGAGGAICFASGFSEAAAEDESAEALQAKLLEAAADMPMVGPNCYGFINYVDGAMLWPDQHGGRKVDSGVALITQSSNIAINLTMQQRGLPIAYVLTAGNQAQSSLADLAAAILDDDRVTALGLHIEGFKDVRAFESLAALAHKKKIPIVALKTGETASSRAALVSHTRSISGDDAAGDAFLKRLGIARVHSFNVLIETLKVLHTYGVLSGKRLVSMSCSGGEAALLGDAAARHGLECPDLESPQRDQLREVLGNRVALANPLDYHTYIWNDSDAMTAMMSAAMNGPFDSSVLILDFPRLDRCEAPSWDVALDAYIKAGQTFNGLQAVMATLPENLPESVSRKLLAANIVPLSGVDDGLTALSVAAWLGRRAGGSLPPPVWLNEYSLGDTAEVPVTGLRLVSGFVDNKRGSARKLSDDVWGRHAAEASRRPNYRLLDEIAAKRWLARYGSIVPTGVRLSFADVRSSRRLSRALDKASPVLSYPLVAKGLGVAHKSDVNAIQLDIDDRRRLDRAIRDIECDGGCLIEEQITDGVAELLVSVVPDPVHGLVLTIAAGGVHAEILDDACQALLPVSRSDVDDMLGSLRCNARLRGYRGGAMVDRRALLDAIDAIQQAALQLGPRLVELEVNPLICAPERCVAVDALIAVRDLPLN